MFTACTMPEAPQAGDLYAHAWWSTTGRARILKVEPHPREPGVVMVTCSASRLPQGILAEPVAVDAEAARLPVPKAKPARPALDPDEAAIRQIADARGIDLEDARREYARA
jgi:hypothetical protein